MMTMDTALSGVSHLGLDTSPLIYFVEAHAGYDTLVTNIFQRFSDGRLVGVTSTITLTEVLVQPIRHGSHELYQRYLTLLLNSYNFSTLPIDSVIAERAADLRARYNLRTPDALQVAVALENRCEAFVTNDSGLKRVVELKVLVLDELSL